MSTLFDPATPPASSKPLPQVGGLQLRDYQQKAVDAAMEADNGILVKPTGSGKSLVIAGIVNRLDGPAVILQPTKEILESNYDKIERSGFRGASVDQIGRVRDVAVRAATLRFRHSAVPHLHHFALVR